MTTELKEHSGRLHDKMRKREKEMKLEKSGYELVCPSCGGQAELRDSEEIYHGVSYGLVWVCKNYPKCDCYVGTHRGTATPLGELADFELRRWRNRAHAVFDPLWIKGKFKNTKKRTELYDEIGIQMGKIPLHIAECDVEECKRLIEIIKTQYQEK